MAIGVFTVIVTLVPAAAVADATVFPATVHAAAVVSPVQASLNVTVIVVVVVVIVLILVALLQVSRMSQNQLRELELESVRQQYRQQMDFRAKASNRRFDTIENNRQADMLETQFKPLGQTTSPQGK